MSDYRLTFNIKICEKKRDFRPCFVQHIGPSQYITSPPISPRSFNRYHPNPSSGNLRISSVSLDCVERGKSGGTWGEGRTNSLVSPLSPRPSLVTPSQTPLIFVRSLSMAYSLVLSDRKSADICYFYGSFRAHSQ